MIFLTRLKVLFKRKSTLFWVLVFPILLASAEYFAFGKFINSTPIETISIGVIEENTPSYLTDIFTEAMLEEDKALYEVKTYTTLDSAQKGLEEDEIELYVHTSSNELKIEAKKNSTAITITSSIIKQAKIVEKTIEDAYKHAIESGQNPSEVVNVEEITANMTKDIDYFKDVSKDKNATFYTFYFYALMAMACLYAALFGVSIINDIRADRSSLGIRISSSVVSKQKLILSYFSAGVLLQVASSCILYIFLAYILRIPLGGNIGFILLTLILGGLAGISIGMLIGAFVKGEEAKCQGIITLITLSLSCFAGLMSVDVKHLIDQYASFINWINPASLITNSLYALYYYDTYTSYIIYTCLLAGISVIILGIVIWKTRGEKYASL